MAQLVVKRGPTAATAKENTIQDWDSFLHSLWLEKMTANPEFYSDAIGDPR